MMSGASRTSKNEWRVNRPAIQALNLWIVLFLVPGMNSLIIGLGAGGSRPSNIEVVDRINIVATVFMMLGGIFGGTVNNKIGPKYTSMIGCSGYCIYTGSLWALDQGQSPIFAYFAAVYKGLASGFLYTTVGYISTSYAREKHRGVYIGAISSSFGMGSVVGSAIVLGLTENGGKMSSHVPSKVYITIITLQIIGCLTASLLQSPSKVHWSDGQAIVVSLPKSWREELRSFPRAIMTPSVLLLSVALYGSQMIYSLTGSLNAYRFNARTRSVINFSFWLSSSCGSVILGFVFDAKFLGNRRRRSIVVATLVTVLLLGSHIGLLYFLATQTVDRHKAPQGIDWSDGSAFVNLLVIFIFLGFTGYVYQNYLLWLLATFTNDPAVLSLFSGYVEALKALGVITSYAIDSKKTAFLTEEITYFSLCVAGLALAIVSAARYTRDTNYEQESRGRVSYPVNAKPGLREDAKRQEEIEGSVTLEEDV